MASSSWSPIRSMVLYGPVFRREVRSWLPLVGPLVGPWSFMVPYFVLRDGPRGPCSHVKPDRWLPCGSVCVSAFDLSNRHL